MAVCKIQKGIGLDCTTSIAPGTQDRLILLSREDYLDVVRDVNFTEGNVITDILRKVGTKAYAFYGMNNSNVMRSSFARTTYFGNYVHEVDFIAFNLSPDILAELKRMNRDRLIAVVEDNNGWIRVLGLGSGLITTNNGSDTADQDIGGAHRITLSSDKEKDYPAFLSVYSGTAPNLVYEYADSKLAADSLLVAAV